MRCWEGIGNSCENCNIITLCKETDDDMMNFTTRVKKEKINGIDTCIGCKNEGNPHSSANHTS